ncbi:MAG: hypothetical protein SA378_01160 [Sedimentibacter sp.]|uniref:hypothetical protein n=1 Tax=Sedimentibacter sp. TaxID=1960295 RepID=UPI0029815E59|nr:hypothetical protein [Sedimentibacter sp.]MDW5298740.1 hypothetical protein [Sedimentibacter sp.]
MKALICNLKSKIDSKKIAVSTAVITTAATVPAFAETTSLTFNFDPAEMFTWTNTMLSALMPVLYITLGISLAFIIINALKYAFR